ncbi:MAG: universal stress protein [Ilumatobacteraceae bacterium]|jgi:nucleotide-binding universal stress UspA family protein
MTSIGRYDSPAHHRLVIGFDGSDSSLSALEWAAAEAESRAASVRIVSSYSLTQGLDLAAGASAAGIDLTEIAAGCLDQLRTATTKVFEEHPGVEHDIEAVGVSPALTLLAEAEHADLVVVGSSGAGAIMRFLLGTVTASLLAKSPCPVVIVPATTRPPTSRIVVGTDGSEHAAHAVRWAIDEADRRHLELVIVHAWAYRRHLTIEGVDRADDFTPVDAELILDEAVEAARSVGSGNVRGELVEGRATETLLEMSETADLLVLGARGSGGFRRMLFGSTASAAAAHSSCPTVIVR